MIRISIDAMGGDHAPREVVHGAVLAALEYKIAIILVGPEAAIRQELERPVIRQLLQGKSPAELNISIVNASEVIQMGEKPGWSVVKKKDSSIVVATKLVREGKADGIVAAGSTGAAAVAAQICLGKVANIDRCAIACTMPTIHAKPCFLIDAGASVAWDAYQMVQLGLMGHVLAKGLYNIDKPRVGLLNIGTEETKGTDVVREAYELFKASKELNFIGFVEGRDYPMGKVDVVVTDGFTGNISLKTAEGIASMMSFMLREELMGSLQGKIAGVIGKSAFKNLKARVDKNEFGGALLVGIKGVCVIAHGGSKHTAVKNAIRVAKDMVAAGVVQKIESVLNANNGSTSELTTAKASVKEKKKK